MVSRRSFLALSLLVALLLGTDEMSQLVPPEGLATPTGLFVTETELALVVFLCMVFVALPFSVLLRERAGSLFRFKWRLNLPLFVRAMVFLVTAIGLFVFLFWATADVLGGYNGYSWSFDAHPFLRQIYNASGLRYIPHTDVGTDASIFFGLAVAGLIVLRLGSGLWTALKDSLTLFVAPILGLFELAVWYNAPNDMTWHVIDALWAGGVNDGGWRSFDYPGSGAFIFSNWFVLMVCLLLLASRLPFLSAPSQVFEKLSGLSVSRQLRKLTTRYRRLTSAKVIRHRRKP